MCARQGALTSWLKSNADPARGTASRMQAVKRGPPVPSQDGVVRTGAMKRSNRIPPFRRAKLLATFERSGLSASKGSTTRPFAAGAIAGPKPILRCNQSYKTILRQICKLKQCIIMSVMLLCCLWEKPTTTKNSAAKFALVKNLKIQAAKTHR